MKKMLSLVLALAMCASLMACGGGDKTTTESTGGNTQQGAAATAAEGKVQGETEAPKGDGEKESVLYYGAYIGDFGLNDMGWRAANAAADKYGYDLKLVEYGADSSQAVNSLVDALDTNHYDYVLAMGWYIADTIVEKSKSGEWADTTFILFDTSPLMDLSGTDNIYGISFAQNEGSFLVAIYSALMTKTGKIGACINLDSPITNDFGTGWLCGYKYVVKELGLDVDMMYTYLGELTVQGDYESVNVVMDNGCDYVYNVAGSVALGAMQAADEKGGTEAGRFIIGTDYDQYSYFASVGDTQGYETMVTSMLKNIEPCVALIFENIHGDAEGIVPGNSVYGLAVNGTGLADNENYQKFTPKEVQDQITEIAQKVIDGEIDVVSYFDFETYDAFANYRNNPDADFAP